MKPANPKLGAKNKQETPKRWKPKYHKPKTEKLREGYTLCRIIPPLVALIPDLLDTPVPINYNPTQAIELLNFKIKNRLLL